MTVATSDPDGVTVQINFVATATSLQLPRARTMLLSSRTIGASSDFTPKSSSFFAQNITSSPVHVWGSTGFLAI